MGVDVSALRPQRHNPPPGWPPDVFEKLTDAIAQVLASTYRQAHESERRADGDSERHRFEGMNEERG